MYTRAANAPPKEIEDIRAMDQDFNKGAGKKFKTAEDFYNSIVSYAPAIGHGVLRKAQVHELSYDHQSKGVDHQEEMLRSIAFISEGGKRLLSQAGYLDWLQMFNWGSEDSEE